MGAIVSTYFLYAAVKGELFPSGTLLGGINPHVSLIGSLGSQLGRGAQASFFDFKHNLFWIIFRKWIKWDGFFIIAGIVATVINVFLAFKKRYVMFIAILTVSFWYFLLRGGVVLEFYIVPLLPILGLNIGIIVCELFKPSQFYIRYKILSAFLTLAVISGILLFYVHNKGYVDGQSLYTSDQTTAQIESIDWMRKNFIPNSFVVIDNYGYIDLHDKSLNNSKFKNVEWYWKVDEDPAIRQILNNNPANITYIALTPQMQGDINSSGLKFVGQALDNSRVFKRFKNDGWGVELWSTRYPNQILALAWDNYKKYFIKSDGRTIDPYRNDGTTSESQSYTLLRAVWLNDKKQFDTSWKWTKDNLQLPNYLFKWQTGIKNGGVVDNGTASDADEDIALALAFASKRWNDPTYLSNSKNIIRSIWSNEVKTIQNTPYLIAGNWALQKDVAIINPSYLSPYSYRIFAQIDPEHGWIKLVDSSYHVFTDCTKSNLDKSISVGLMPNWCAINQNGEVIVSPENGLNDTNYSYDAFRSTWRIALDYVWNKDQRAKNYLVNNDFLRKQWQTKHHILVGYTHDGKVNQNYESAGAYGADIGNFIVADPKMADDVYKKEILYKFYQDETHTYWEDPKNYYVQNWAWFGTALYGNLLPNLWK